MTTSEHTHATLSQIRADMQRVSRAETIAEKQGEALERAADLFQVGLWQESRFVAERGRAS